jgi:hypothetical protein
MKAAKGMALLLILLGNSLLTAKESPMLQISAAYEIYSYDLNYLYCQGDVVVSSPFYTLKGQVLKFDLARHRAVMARDATLVVGDQSASADLIEVNLGTGSFKLTWYGDTIASAVLFPGFPGSTDSPFPVRERTLADLRKSLVYFLCNQVEVMPSLAMYGNGITAYIEGMQSISLKRFKLDGGQGSVSESYFMIDKLWYNSGQGAVLNTRFNLMGTTWGKSDNSLNLQYDLFGENPSAKALNLFFSTKTLFNLTRTLRIDLNANYITDNIVSFSFDVQQQWSRTANTTVALEYRKPYDQSDEMWLRLNQTLLLPLLGGQFTGALGYEKQGQYSADLGLQQHITRGLDVTAKYKLSHLLVGSDSFNDLTNQSLSVSYSNALFNIFTDYSLNSDLLNNQSQASPQVRINSTPILMYENILRLNLSSSVMLNHLKKNDFSDDLLKANVAFQLTCERVDISPDFNLTVAFSGEQLIDKDPINNFTTGGAILRFHYDFLNFSEFELLYNLTSRRQTRNWLIEGSSTQDVTAMFRLKEKPGNVVKAWTSWSYNPVLGSMRVANLDCSITVFKGWMLQTQMNYDFLFKQFNYDFYLIRKAGRLTFRLSYRSLSKQFLFEMLPE